MKANDNTSLLKMISGLQNKIDRLDRKTSSGALLTGLTAYESGLINTTPTDLLWDVNSATVCEGIIIDDPAFFTIMSEGLYSITLTGFVSPAVADLQLRFVVGETRDGPWYNKRQINCFGFTPRTAFTTTFNYYLYEGNSITFRMVASATTTLLLRRDKTEQEYPSPILTIAQISGAYELGSRPNEWYGDPDV